MARIRSIKPDFWTSEQVMECSSTARLMFIGMWNFADDHGRLPCSPKTIKAQIFPSDNITPENVRRMIDELSTNGLIHLYTVDGKEFLLIKGWHHQKIDKRQHPKYPEPPEDHSTNVPRMVSTDLRGSEGIGEDNTCPVAKATRTKNEYSEDFETNFWKPFPRTAIMSKKEAFKEWSKLTPEQRLASCRSIEPYRRHLQQTPNLQAVHACRFLSQNRAEGILELAAEKPNYRGHFV